MLVEFLNKLQLLLFFMAFLVTFRHGFYFFQNLVTSTEDDPKKYKLNKTQLFFLCISISYVLTVLIFGIK